jgi:hypothetical protein
MFNRRLLSLTLAVGLVLGLSGLAMANIPDPSLSAAASAGGTLYICPEGDGETIASVSATISVTVKDSGGQPIQNYPFQDIWPGSTVPGEINQCNAGSSADGNTDASGQTTISGGIAGGGTTDASAGGGVSVFLAGVQITGTGSMAISINSPDITGDLVVNLADIGPFSTDINVAYNFRSDYFDDGIINLADIGIFSAHIGHACQ